MDTKQSDCAAGDRGICRGEFVWVWAMGKLGGGGADGDDDCAGCFGWAHRAAQESGDAGWGADRYPRRPHDRERLFHVFCGGGDGVAVAAGFLFCAGRGYGFSARPGDARRAFRLGRERDAADVVGTRAGGVALEPRFVRGDEMLVFLLPGIGIGADARASGFAEWDDRGFAFVGPRRRACFDLDDGGVLFVAWIAGAGGGMEVRVGERSTDARGEENHAGGNVMGKRKAKEVQEVNEIEEKNGGVAAFFDLDGTLVPKPSLEKRFLRMLRYRRLVGFGKYFLWLREAVRLAPRGIKQVLYANKMYLRGVRADEAVGTTDNPVPLGVEDGAEKGGKRKRQVRMPVPPFYPEAVERVVWHCEHGHSIVIVSGTLEPLAKKAALDLENMLAGRGIGASIKVCATRLEIVEGTWTGRIAGEAMFGEAKAQAIKRFCASSGIELSKCFAYGDSTNDRSMLEAIGRPTVVNPSDDLARIAGRNEWPILRWNHGGISTQSSPSSAKRQKARATRKEMQIASAKPGYRI